MASLATHYLRTIAGADRDIENEPIKGSTRVLYGFVGFLLLVVSILSALLAGYTWSRVFNSIFVGFLVGSLWFCVSLALNVVISWKLDQSKYQGESRWATLAVVILLAFTLAAVNTLFMEMKVFESEITAQVEGQFRDKRAALERELLSSGTTFDRKANELREATEANKRQARAEVEKALSSQLAEVSQRRARYDEAVKALTTEVEGNAPSRRMGEGSVARRKRQEMAEVKALLDAATASLVRERERLNPQVDVSVKSIEAALVPNLQELEQQKKAYEGRLARDIQELDSTPREGFLQKSAALTAVFLQQPVYAGLFLLMFSLIEGMVVYLKLMTGQTEYHLAREAQWVAHKAEFSKQIREKRAESRAHELADLEDYRKFLEAHVKTSEAERAYYLSKVKAQLEAMELGGVSPEDISKARRELLRQIPQKLITRSN